MNKDNVNTLTLLVGVASALYAFMWERTKQRSIRNEVVGEATASAIVLIIGAILAKGQKSYIPFVGAMVVSLFYVGGYEYLLARDDG